MTDDSMTGMVGTVTGTVRPGTLGEVMLAIRGGVEAFYAGPYDGEEVIPVGAGAAAAAPDATSPVADPADGEPDATYIAPGSPSATTNTSDTSATFTSAPEAVDG